MATGQKQFSMGWVSEGKVVSRRTRLLLTGASVLAPQAVLSAGTAYATECVGAGTYTTTGGSVGAVGGATPIAVTTGLELALAISNTVGAPGGFASEPTLVLPGVGNDNGNPDATACGAGANADGAEASAFGLDSTAIGTNATAPGDFADANGEFATATGGGSTANGGQATATGTNATANGAFASANGVHSSANGDHSTATGTQATANGLSATATGVALRQRRQRDRHRYFERRQRRQRHRHGL